MELRLVTDMYTDKSHGANIALAQRLAGKKTTVIDLTAAQSSLLA